MDCLFESSKDKQFRKKVEDKYYQCVTHEGKYDSTKILLISYCENSEKIAIQRMVDLIKANIKDDDIPVKQKYICLLLLRDMMNTHNKILGNYVVKKILQRLIILAQFKKESNDSTRGREIFARCKKPQQDIAIKFHTLLLECLMDWGTNWPKNVDGPHNTFKQILQQLLLQKVTMPHIRIPSVITLKLKQGNAQQIPTRQQHLEERYARNRLQKQALSEREISIIPQQHKISEYEKNGVRNVAPFCRCNHQQLQQSPNESSEQQIQQQEEIQGSAENRETKVQQQVDRHFNYTVKDQLVQPLQYVSVPIRKGGFSPNGKQILTMKEQPTNIFALGKKQPVDIQFESKHNKHAMKFQFLPQQPQNPFSESFDSAQLQTNPLETAYNNQQDPSLSNPFEQSSTNLQPANPFEYTMISEKAISNSIDHPNIGKEQNKILLWLYDSSSHKSNKELSKHTNIQTERTIGHPFQSFEQNISSIENPQIRIDLFDPTEKSGSEFDGKNEENFQNNFQIDEKIIIEDFNVLKKIGIPWNPFQSKTHIQSPTKNQQQLKMKLNKFNQTLQNLRINYEEQKKLSMNRNQYFHEVRSKYLQNLLKIQQIERKKQVYSQIMTCFEDNNNKKQKMIADENRKIATLNKLKQKKNDCLRKLYECKTKRTIRQSQQKEYEISRVIFHGSLNNKFITFNQTLESYRNLSSGMHTSRSFQIDSHKSTLIKNRYS